MIKKYNTILSIVGLVFMLFPFFVINTAMNPGLTGIGLIDIWFTYGGVYYIPHVLLGAFLFGLSVYIDFNYVYKTTRDK